MTAWVEVNGVSLRYEVSGAGSRGLVLIHEMGSTMETWDEVLPGLPADRRILRYDTRGAGLSEKIRGAGRIDDFAADAMALVDHAGIAGPVALAGCAVGAAIAIRIAARWPERVSALVAMAPAVGVPEADRPALRERLAAVEQGLMRPWVEGRFDTLVPEPLRGDARRVEVLRRRLLIADPASYAAIFRVILDLDMTADLAALRCPTLVIAGRHDSSRPPDKVKPVADAIAGARYEVLETGHFMPTHTPALIAERISAFLAETGG